MAGEISHRIASRLWHALIQFYSQGTKGSRNALFVMEKKLHVVEKASIEKAARILEINTIKKKFETTGKVPEGHHIQQKLYVI